MLLIVGLGNPGGEYARHRHNVGFMALDAIHARHGFPRWRRRFQSATAEATLAGDKCLLVKPQTFMNESGRAVAEAVRFYRLAPADVLVIHDEVDLPPGKVRMKKGGGVAGHNGLRSIGGAIGNDFRRLRIGVGHPGIKELVAGHVLRDFAKADAAWLEALMEAIADNAPLLVEGKDQTFANRLHLALGDEPAGRKDTAARKTAPKAKAKAADPLPPATGAAAGAGGGGEGPLARGLRKWFGR
jgi:PTH1 family peptidyl-tRNA hydrolase